MITANDARRLAGEKTEIEKLSAEIGRLASLGFKMATVQSLPESRQEKLVELGYKISIVWDSGHISGYVISWE